MNIIGICLTSDEGDVIGRTLEAALDWCDFVIVIDHDSTDSTPDILRELASSHPSRIRLIKYSGPFNNGIRALAFNYFRELMPAEGPTWWCRLDSDEFYVDNPRKFLERVPWWYRSVAACSFQFYFTDEDVRRYAATPEKYRGGNAVDTLSYYSCNSTELRFFRDAAQPWMADEPWPKRDTIYPIFPTFIRLRHYQYRYPEQISSRIDKRRAGEAGKIFVHEMREDWLRETIGGGVGAESCQSSAADGTWRERVVSRHELRAVETYEELKIEESNIQPVPGLFRQIAATIFRKVRRAAEPFAVNVKSRF